MSARLVLLSSTFICPVLKRAVASGAGRAAAAADPGSVGVAPSTTAVPGAPATPGTAAAVAPAPATLPSGVVPGLGLADGLPAASAAATGPAGLGFGLVGNATW